MIEKFELCDRDSIFGYKHVKDNFITNDRIIGFKIYDFFEPFYLVCYIICMAELIPNDVRSAGPEICPKHVKKIAFFTNEYTS